MTEDHLVQNIGAVMATGNLSISDEDGLDEEIFQVIASNTSPILVHMVL